MCLSLGQARGRWGQRIQCSRTAARLWGIKCSRRVECRLHASRNDSRGVPGGVQGGGGRWTMCWGWRRGWCWATRTGPRCCASCLTRCSRIGRADPAHRSAHGLHWQAQTLWVMRLHELNLFSTESRLTLFSFFSANSSYFVVQITRVDAHSVGCYAVFHRLRFWLLTKEHNSLVNFLGVFTRMLTVHGNDAYVFKWCLCFLMILMFWSDAYILKWCL